MLGAVFSVLTFVVKGPVGYFAGALSAWLRAWPRVLVGMHRTSGAVLVALGVRLAFERRGNGAGADFLVGDRDHRRPRARRGRPERQQGLERRASPVRRPRLVAPRCGEAAAAPPQRSPHDARGRVIIKAQQHRSLEMNRAEALERLQALVQRRSRAEAAQTHAADARVEAAPPGEQGQARRIKALRERSSTSGSADAARGGTRPTRPPP